MSNILQRAAIAAHHLTDPVEIYRYTSYSLRVWAATLINRTGCTGLYIQIRLRWKREIFLLYLRKTHAITDKTILLHSRTLTNSDSNQKNSQS